MKHFSELHSYIQNQRNFRSMMKNLHPNNLGHWLMFMAIIYKLHLLFVSMQTLQYKVRIKHGKPYQLLAKKYELHPT